jgi:hypothetical protein
VRYVAVAALSLAAFAGAVLWAFSAYIALVLDTDQPPRRPG